jgi:hypothetical protein
MTVYNSFWCDKCPTRFNVESESSTGVSCDCLDGDECPVCGNGTLASWDTLIAHGLIPYGQKKGDDVEIHKRWLALGRAHALRLAGEYDPKLVSEQNHQERTGWLKRRIEEARAAGKKKV